jgi:hypothetical protein
MESLYRGSGSADSGGSQFTVHYLYGLFLVQGIVFRALLAGNGAGRIESGLVVQYTCTPLVRDGLPPH